MFAYFRAFWLFGFGFILSLVLMIVLISYTLIHFNHLQNQIETIEHEYHKKNSALETFAKNSNKRSSLLLRMYKNPDPFERNSYFDLFHETAHIVAKANRTFLSLNIPYNEKVIHQKIYKKMKISSEIRNKIADWLLEEEDEKAIHLYLSKSLDSQKNVLKIVNQLKELQKNNYDTYLKEKYHEQKINLLRVTILGLTLFILFCVLGFFIIRYILQKESITLKRSESTMKTMGQGIMFTNTQGKIDYINPYAQILLNAIQFNAMGKSIDKLDVFYNKESEKLLNNIFEQVTKDKSSIQRYNQCFIQGYDHDARFWVSVTIAGINDKKNKFLGIMILFNDISEVYALNKKLEHEASYDNLTKLYNRKIINHKLKEQLQKNTLYPNNSILFYIDLDNFKKVNDTAGHPAGDQLLIDIAVLLKSHVRENDIVGRMGGDEFVIILYRCNLDQAKKIAMNIIYDVEKYTLVWQENEYKIGTSIGITTIDPNAENIEDITSKADTALYQAKNNGKNQYVVN